METYRATLCAALVTVLLLISVTVAEGEVVRLVGGETPYEGRVEMFIENEWLPVVHFRHFGKNFKKRWSFTAANILCNELGYKGAMSYESSWTLSGDPRRRVTNIRCNENLESLFNCDFDFYYNSNLKSAATVKCNYDAFLGCYSGLDRYMPIFIDGLTIQYCLERCLRKHYTYAGLHDGSHCVCYNAIHLRALTEVSGDHCQEQCSGDSRQRCGGNDTVGIYLASMGSCGGHEVGTGTIYSPGFPGYYMENQECTWHVSAQQPRSILEFEFVLFDVDEETDSLTLYEMMNGRRKNIEVSNLSAMSCSNTVYVTFQSGINDGTRRGIFTLKYREVPNCPVLPIYVGGILYYKGVCPHLIGETVSITCKTGFKLSSPHQTVKCQQDTTWNGTLPECIAIDCGNPGEVQNADRIGTQYSYNSSVIYTCHDGYYTNGNRTICCTIEGQWTEKPSCFLNKTQLSEGVTASAGWAIGISLGVVTAILIGLALIIFLMRRKIQLTFRNTLGSSSRTLDEIIYCKKPQRRNSKRWEGAVNDDSLRVISENDECIGVGADQMEDQSCIDEETGFKKQVKPPLHCENLKQNSIKVDFAPQDDKLLRSNKSEDESLGYNNLIIDGKVGKRSLTGDSGSVENMAYESADINDDDGDLYIEIVKDGDIIVVDNADFVLVHHTTE